MTVEGYNRFCGALPHTRYVVQWGGAHVWKVVTKVFAIAWHDDDDDADDLLVTFKCSDLSFEVLKVLPGCRPAPYLASRGLKWIQRTDPRSVDDGALCEYLTGSYHMVARGLPKRLQHELGLSGEAPPRPDRTKRNKHDRPANPARRSPETPTVKRVARAPRGGLQ